MLNPFLVGFVIMSLSSLAIFAKGSKVPPARHHTYMHSGVAFIAATAYLAMTFGIGDIVKPDLTVTFVARYVDWTFTTPILLAGLVLAGLHERGEKSGFLVGIIVVDVLMIVAGLLSGLAVDPLVKWVWYGWSCVAFLGVLYVLWGPVKLISRERGGAMDGAYTANLSFLTVMWILYPIVFAVGPEGTGAISAQASVWAILVLDVVSKVVYAFFADAKVTAALRDTGATWRA